MPRFATRGRRTWTSPSTPWREGGPLACSSPPLPRPLPRYNPSSGNSLGRSSSWGIRGRGSQHRALFPPHRRRPPLCQVPSPRPSCHPGPLPLRCSQAPSRPTRGPFPGPHRQGLGVEPGVSLQPGLPGRGFLSRVGGGPPLGRGRDGQGHRGVPARVPGKLAGVCCPHGGRWEGGGKMKRLARQYSRLAARFLWWKGLLSLRVIGPLLLLGLWGGLARGQGVRSSGMPCTGFPCSFPRATA
ncbi:hypothetical protein A0O31_02551 (plasmid) [Thermus brockianus]|uniref:Uncharacterized protein n=1 Tax=Thermus brockianus TaxID=56956 RepID=A0A1J0LWJ5_THEBO|nr:hypothetical protein A0O31_02551 [Thermus brockianus]